MNDIAISPADIYRRLNEHAYAVIDDYKTKQNLEIIIDHHWFFLHSKSFKETQNIGKYIGKWKYDASSDNDLLAQTLKLLPYIASGDLPICKFTNFANTPRSKKLIAVYCYPVGKSKDEIQQILTERGLQVRWSGDKYRRP